MRRLMVVWLALVLVGCASAPDDKVDASQADDFLGSGWTCYLATFALLGNQFYTCLKGEKVLTFAYFPNYGNTPTTCATAGRVVDRGSNALSLGMMRGGCENGRLLGEATYHCERQPPNGLQCDDPKGVVIEYAAAPRPDWAVRYLQILQRNLEQKKAAAI